MVTSDASLRATRACRNGVRCAQSCHVAFHVRKLVDKAVRELEVTDINREQNDVLRPIGNGNNLNNNVAHGQGGQQAVDGRRRAHLTRVLEMQLCLISPKAMIAVCTHIPPANNGGAPRPMAGPPTVAFGNLRGVYTGLSLAMELMDALWSLDG